MLHGKTHEYLSLVDIESMILNCIVKRLEQGKKYIISKPVLSQNAIKLLEFLTSLKPTHKHGLNKI